MSLADGAEQLHAFFAGGGVGGEVHILHHQVDAGAALVEQGEAFFGGGGVQRFDVV